MTIRAYQEDKDLDLYIEAERESFKATYPGLDITKDIERYFRRTISDSIDLNDNVGITVEVEGTPVGMILISSASFYKMPMCYIDNVYIKPDYRGRGIIEEILGAAEQQARARGIGLMQLDVSILNERAIEAYRKLGYVAVRQCMEKRL